MFDPIFSGFKIGTRTSLSSPFSLFLTLNPQGNNYRIKIKNFVKF